MFAERTFHQNKRSHFRLHSFVRPEVCETAPVSSELRIEIGPRIEFRKSDRAFVSACGGQSRYCYDCNEKWLA
jgi:hypothetical protein